MDERLKFLNKISFRGPLALLIVLGSFAFLFMLMYRKVPTENKEVLTFAAGQVLVLAAGVVGWYFGSSKDKADSDKAAHVKEILNTPDANP